MPYADPAAQKAYDHRRYAANAPAVKAASKAYYDEHKAEIAVVTKRYRRKNARTISQTKRQYRQKNLEQIQLKGRDYAKQHPRTTYKKLWYEANREKVIARTTAWCHQKRQTDIQYRLRSSLSARMRSALRHTKQDTTVTLLGCSIAHLKAHLEAQFTDGMTWQSYGRTGWHIDHRIPCAAFDLTDPVQRLTCFHFTNLQPLWAADNIRKGARR